MNMIKLVLFDLYNTLAYINPEEYKKAKTQMANLAGTSPELFFELWRQYSRDYNRGDILTAEERVSHVLRELRVNFDVKTIREIADIEYKLQSSAAYLAPDTITLLTSLQKMGLKLGLITNTGFSTINSPKTLSIDKYFDSIIMSYKIRSLKPGRHIYQTICEELDAKGEECLYVGDGDDNEIEGAMAFGMTAILLAENKEKILHTKIVNRYNYKVSNLLEVLQIAQSLISS
jgi:putative hydrolase of the HAD superfamily